MRKNSVIALLALVLSAVAFLPGPASAIDDLRVHASATDVNVRKGQCDTALIHGFGNWEGTEASVSLVVRAPGGAKFRDFAFTDASGAFDRSVRMCYSNREGVYKVEVSVEVTDDLGFTQSESVSTSYRMDRVVPKKSARINVRTGRVSGEGEFKYGAVGTLYRSGRLYAGRRVWLIAKSSTGWVKVDSQRTGYRGVRRGKVAWIFKPTSTRWGMWYAGDDRTRSAWSDPFRFPSGRVGPSRLAELRSLVRQR